MAKVLVTEEYLETIADSLRELFTTDATYTPAEMAQTIDNIQLYNGLVHEIPNS